MDTSSTDVMIARLQKEVDEREAFINGVIANANDNERDLTDSEKQLTAEARARIEACSEQLELLDAAKERTVAARARTEKLNREMTRMRAEADAGGTVEYRSTGDYLKDYMAAQGGSKAAAQRLEVFSRVADHQMTPDNLGVIPDPILAPVINFIDNSRPIVSSLGPRPLTNATWHRPRVTQHTEVGPQGTAGGPTDEKSELVSQKMLITRLTANAVTYGGYVNVSRQNIDFSNPQIFDLVVNDLASQYAIQTEAATAAALAATTATGVGYTSGDPDSVSAAVWTAAAQVYTGVSGQGSMYIVVAPDVLASFGPLFNPVNPQNAASPGFTANNFGQGVMGTISGIPVVMSAALAPGTAFLYSTAAIEVYEQRIGTLQVTEPSVLGVQVAYAGYFTPLMIEDAAIVPLEGTS